MTPNIVIDNSRDFGIDKENLPEKSGLNVKVYTEIPQGNYFVLEHHYSAFSYEKNSVSYKKIEKKKHLTKLRKWAGKCGANAVIVIFSDKAYDTGGYLMGDNYGIDVLHSDNMSLEFIDAFAVYCE